MELEDSVVFIVVYEFQTFFKCSVNEARIKHDVQADEIEKCLAEDVLLCYRKVPQPSQHLDQMLVSVRDGGRIPTIILIGCPRPEATRIQKNSSKRINREKVTSIVIYVTSREE